MTLWRLKLHSLSNAQGDVTFYLDSSFSVEGVIYYDGAIAVVEDRR